MVVAHATVLRLTASLTALDLGGRHRAPPDARVQQLAAVIEVGGSSRTLQRICIDHDSCEVRCQGGGTPRAEGVFPPCVPPPVPLGFRQLRSKHLRRAHSGCESNAPSNREQNGVPIGDSRRLASGFARAISVLTTAPTSGA